MIIGEPNCQTASSTRVESDSRGAMIQPALIAESSEQLIDEPVIGEYLAPEDRDRDRLAPSSEGR